MRPSIIDLLGVIAISLEKIAKVLETVSEANSSQQRTPTLESDSIGSCPQCDSTQIDQEGAVPKALFHCRECDCVWINNVRDYFNP